MTEPATGKHTGDPKGNPTGAVTFLFTDIQGSTAMWERDAKRMQETLARHDEILKATVAEHGGRVFKMVGDACCAAFPSAPDALMAALAAQGAIFNEPWDERSRVRVRMALHTGNAEERGGDYFGPTVNRVARLLSAGHGGQTLLSRATKELVEGHLPEGVSVRDMGERRLKDLKEPERIHQLLAPGLPSEFPPLKTLETASNEDRYRLIRQIGSGGMAEVYLAYDEFLRRKVAFKVLDRKYAQDKEAIERFRREARNAASLRHPNIVATHDRGETEGGTYYIVMEHMEGGTLEDLIAREGALPPRVAAEIALEIADALHAAHENGVIHRDIKPQNILLSASGEAKVADFGIARAASATTMTQAGSILGTVHYISPEQALGEPATPRSDLYSLGVVLYEMITGELPYDAETPVGVVMKHVSGIARSPRDTNPDVPEEIDAVAGRLLSRNPEARYPDAATLAEELRTVAEGLPEATGTEGARAAGVRAARSKRGTRPGTSGGKLGMGAGAMRASLAGTPGGGLQRRGVLLALALVLLSVGVIAFAALSREDRPSGAAAAQLEGEKIPDTGSFGPGTYKTEEFEPAFSFELPGNDTDDWRVELPEQPDYLDVRPTGYGSSEDDFIRPAPGISFLNPSKVYPTQMFTDGMQPVSAPKDMAAWVREHPDLVINREEAINVGGVPGTWFDVILSTTGIPFFRTSNGADVLLGSESETRLVVLNDVAGEALVIVIDGPKQQLLESTQVEGKAVEPFLPRAQDALASVKFAASDTDSTTAPPVTDIPAETPSAEGGSAAGVKSIPPFVGQDPPSLSPGRYATRFFASGLSFEVGEGWAAISDSAGGFELLPQSEVDNFGSPSPQYSSLGFNVIDLIFDPRKQGDISSAPPDNAGLVSPAPDDIVAWLEKHPHLETSAPEPVTVGGKQGTRIDVEALPIENYPKQCGGEPCVVLFASDQGNSALFPAGGKSRFVVLEDVEGETVLVSSNAYPAGEFDGLTTEAQKVVDTVEWQSEP